MGNKKKVTLFIVTAILIIAVGILIYFSGLFVPSAIHTNDFSTVVVTEGEVLSTIDATGVVESENEVLLLSPASSIIKVINEEPGNRVKKDDVILQLDTENVISDIEKIKDQLEVKRNNLEKTRL
ncbi:MAG TPA: efflux RND transporter periplasmic adaptor subunit, partial [Prolixibacteraceae bacterium]|nr:efflux RND transporter periplasmic adaptor subunit [Prolixibacteraceae bacterium]